jgi:hypothetical protein
VVDYVKFAIFFGMIGDWPTTKRLEKKKEKEGVAGL